SGRAVDKRSDIYSLGCLLYHLIAGHPPFHGEEVQVLFDHLEREPESLAVVDSCVPRALSEAVQRALAKQPREPFRSMAGLAEAWGRAIIGPMYQAARAAGLTARAAFTARRCGPLVRAPRRRRPAGAPGTLRACAHRRNRS